MVFFASFDNNGNKRWSTYFGGRWETSPYSVSTDKLNGIYFAGASLDDSLFYSPNAHLPYKVGQFDGFLVRFTESNGPNGATISIEECLKAVSPSGNQIWDSTGVYLDTLVSSKGCDSIIEVHAEIITIDRKIDVKGANLYSEEEKGTYQWIECDSDSIIQGATSRAFRAVSNGSYQVIIHKENCVDTSECVDVFWAGLLQSEQIEFSVYPNPADKSLNIQFESLQSDLNITIFNNLGQVIEQMNKKEIQSLQINLGEYSNGIYSVVVENSNGNRVKRFVVNKTP